MRLSRGILVVAGLLLCLGLWRAVAPSDSPAESAVQSARAPGPPGSSGTSSTSDDDGWFGGLRSWFSSSDPTDSAPQHTSPEELEATGRRPEEEAAREQALADRERVGFYGRVLDVEGAAIGGASIELRRAEPLLVARRVESDAGGRFVVEQLVAGRYHLEVGAAGFAPWVEALGLYADRGVEVVLHTAAWLRGQVRRSDGSPAAGAQLELRAGLVDRPQAPGARRVEAVRLAEVADAAGRFELGPMPPGRFDLTAHAGAASASAGGFVVEGEAPDDIHLTLKEGAILEGRVTEAGSGVPVPQAQIELRRRSRGGHGVHTQSAADGSFRFVGAVPGSHDLFARGNGFAEARVLGLQLQAGARLDVSVELARSSSLSGRVLRPDGEGVAEARVGYRIEVLGGGGHSREEFPVATTDDTGAFEITGISALGAIVVVARHPDYGAAQSEPVALQGGAQVEGLVLKLSGAPVRVEGTVSWDDDEPIEGVYVRAGLPRRSASLGAGVSGPDGRFELTGLPAGELEVVASLSDSSQRSVHTLTTEPGERVRLDLRFNRDGPRIEGIVVDSEGEAIIGARISARRRYDRRADERFTTTGAGGTFLIETGEEGSFDVRVSRPGSDAVTHQVVEVPSDPVRIVLTRGGRIDGKAIWRHNGQPVQDMVVEYHWRARHRDGGGGSYRFQNPHGEFTLHDLPVGSYNLMVVSPDGGAGIVARVSVTEGGRRRVTVELDRGGTLRGRVIDRDGRRPLEGALIGVLISGSPFRRLVTRGEGLRGRTDATGNFVIDGVPARAFDVGVLAPGYLEKRFRLVEVPRGEELDLGDVEMTAGREDDLAAEEEFGGIGCTLRRTRRHRVAIQACLQDRPGGLAGLLPGDLITAIDGQNATRMALAEVIALIRGRAGTRLELVVTRGEQDLTLALRRETTGRKDFRREGP